MIASNDTAKLRSGSPAQALCTCVAMVDGAIAKHVAASLAACFLCFAVALSMFSAPAAACSYAEPRLGDRWKAKRNSKPVETGADCSFVNAGLADNHSGGPAINLSNGRFYQELELGTGDDPHDQLLIVDCNAREAIGLYALFKKNANYSVNSCGGEHGDAFDIAPPKGVLTLAEGSSLSELAAMATTTGQYHVDEQLRPLRGPGFREIKYPLKDRVDLLCGCELYYPDSPGAKK